MWRFLSWKKIKDNIPVIVYQNIHCMNFGIYKTFTFHVNMLKDPLSLPLLGIYSTFAFKSKGLKLLIKCSQTVMKVGHFGKTKLLGFIKPPSV